MIRVLLVDDSPIALHILQGLLACAPDIQVVGTAANGREALDLLPVLDPDVICTDLHMPVMNGLEFTRAVMASRPRPILVVSVSVEAGSTNVFHLLEAGAVEVYPKPGVLHGAGQDAQASDLASKIRIVAGVHVFRRTAAPPLAAPALPPRIAPPHDTPMQMVVIGASTGGPQALHQLLSRLPFGFPAPVVCVQHIGSNFLADLLAWLGEASPLPVRQAVNGETPQAGTVYFPREDSHLEFDDAGRFALTDAPTCDGHRPSATVTLRAAVRRFGASTVGVLLTGMGRDGADGMAAIAAAGGVTIAQDEASSVVWGMPKAAVDLGAAKYVLPLEQIAPALVTLVNGGNIAYAPSPPVP